MSTQDQSAQPLTKAKNLSALLVETTHHAEEGNRRLGDDSGTWRSKFSCLIESTKAFSELVLEVSYVPENCKKASLELSSICDVVFDKIQHEIEEWLTGDVRPDDVQALSEWLYSARPAVFLALEFNARNEPEWKYSKLIENFGNKQADTMEFLDLALEYKKDRNRLIKGADELISEVKSKKLWKELDEIIQNQETKDYFVFLLWCWENDEYSKSCISQLEQALRDDERVDVLTYFVPSDEHPSDGLRDVIEQHEDSFNGESHHLVIWYCGHSYARQAPSNMADDSGLHLYLVQTAADRQTQPLPDDPGENAVDSLHLFTIVFLAVPCPATLVLDTENASRSLQLDPVTNAGLPVAVFLMDRHSLHASRPFTGVFADVFAQRFSSTPSGTITQRLIDLIGGNF